MFFFSCFGTIHKSKVNAGHPKLPVPEKPNILAECTKHPSRNAAKNDGSVGDIPSVVIQDEYYSSSVLYSTTENRCFENSSHEATVYCEKCDAIFCESCFGTIHKSKVNAGHPKLPISQKSNRLPKCTEHSSITAEFWCKDPNCVIEEKKICHICLLAGGHKFHQYELLTDQVSNNVEKLKDLMRSTQETVDKYQDRVKSFDVCIATFGYEHPLYLAEIEKITKQFDAKKMQVLKKLEEFTGNSQSRLREKKKQIEAYIDNSEVLLLKIESILKSKQKLYDDTKILDTAEAQLRISAFNSQNDFMKVFDDQNYSLTEEMEMKIMDKNR
ncbi:hypothetical protein GCK72_003668 [Caenorhabditis remanei]|uniref:B box-type domain-containing protein n=1 Tax=Caenorhabditis remanei TaxID=31234 RepID=A0A6A5HBA7_CAERE|nr:hypothetical protein GCK72_003668 [Caenorhabditis remanei]KAF1763723.1 hypothetical protein GCK72_003668 [Caenorhabditis remanei]